MSFDPKTVRAVILADLFAFLFIGGIALFLGFELVPSLVAGAVAGGLSAAIVLGAAMRARQLGTDQPTPPMPRSPGAPDPANAADTTDTTDEDHRG